MVHMIVTKNNKRPRDRDRLALVIGRNYRIFHISRREFAQLARDMTRIIRKEVTGKC